MATRWAIRHNPSGGYLDLPQGRGGKGGTWSEPTPLDGPHPVRLFHTEPAAKISLTCWLKGRVTVSRGHHPDPWGDGDDYSEDWHTEKVPERRREDMEIVEMQLLPAVNTQ